MIKNRMAPTIVLVVIAAEEVRGTGRSNTISMSKTIKITANKKKRVEKGRRALFLGSNPHSNGLDFSRSLNERALMIKVISKTTIGIKRANIANKVIINIHLK